MIYRIEVTDPAGAKIADLSSRSLSFSFKLIRNRASQINLTFDVDDLEAYFQEVGLTISDVLKTNVNEIHIYRNSTQVVAGQINFVDVQISNIPVIAVTAVGWLELFAQRVTEQYKTYTNIDQGQIMWDLIDTSQTTDADADYGITQGTIPTSINRDRVYEYKNIKDAIVELSEVIGGPDFEITPNKVFNVFYPSQGTVRDDIVFNFPGNVIELGFSLDGVPMANRVIGVGSGSGDDNLVSVADNTAPRSLYKLREDVIQYGDISIQATLDAHTDEDVRVRTNLLALPTLKIDGGQAPILGSYGLGDRFLIQSTRYQNLLEPILGYFRIDAIEVNIDSNEFEAVTLRTSKA